MPDLRKCVIQVRAEIPGCHLYIYPVISVLVSRPTDKVNILTTICIDHKLLVNSLESYGKCFADGLTYRAGIEWTSGLYVCTVSYNN